MKSGRSLVSLAQELERQLASKQDLLVPSDRMSYRTEANESRVMVAGQDGVMEYGITELAQRQLADKLKIPFSYFQRMREEKPELLDRNVNTWLSDGEERRMLRTLDGRVRAVLSERYRRLDNFDLADHVLPMLQRLPGARFESVELTETKMYLKAVTERVQYEIEPGDVIQAGVAISNSEVGAGTLSVQPLIFRLVCRNGLIAGDRALRKTHIGRVADCDQDDVVVFREDTLRADDKAFFLKVRDVVEACVSEATLELITEKLRKTKGIRLTGDPSKSVEVLSARHAWNETERAGVLRSLIGGGDLSGYGLINAVTHYSQDVEEYDRATEFEAVGGKLLEMPGKEWKEVAEAN